MGVSPTMIAALRLAQEAGGRLEYMLGGYWIKPGTPRKRTENQLTVPDGPYFTAATMKALRKRGLLEVTATHPKHYFPIELAITEAGRQLTPPPTPH